MERSGGMTDSRLMNMHIDVLYQQTAAGKLTVINEPPFEEAPLLFLGLTKDGVIQKYSENVDDLLKKRLKDVITTQQDELLVGLINQISKRVGLHAFSMGPTYVFPEVKEIEEQVIVITEDNKELLKEDFRFTFLDFQVKQPCTVIIEDGRVVSLCCSARQSNEAAEASVYTMSNYRGKGFGTAVTKAWAQQVQVLGKTALYSTTWDNFASQGVTRKLGLRQYGVGVTME